MPKNQIQPHDYRYCGAKNRKGTPCRLRAGWGTNHVGYGRCKLHGGLSPGAPKGNKNALKHGYYTAEAIAEHSNHHDFLILGMRKGAWLKSFFFGMLAQQITGIVRCPTLLTKTKSPARSGLKKSVEISDDKTCLID